MYKIEFTNEMKRNIKLMHKRGKDISKLTDILNKLGTVHKLFSRFMLKNNVFSAFQCKNVLIISAQFLSKRSDFAAEK